MPRSCCIPGCESNYYKGKYIPIFSFPKDESRRKEWIRSIPRENLHVTQYTGVCIAHFPDEQIIKEMRAIRPDGTELVVPRGKMKLADGAVPSLFPNCPNYLSRTPPMQRTDSEKRREQHLRNEEQKYEDWLAEDNISNFDEIEKNIQRFTNKGWIVRKENTCMYFIMIDFAGCPSLKCVVTLNRNYTVQVTFKDKIISSKKFEWILGEKLCCDTYSKLENLLSAVNNLDMCEVSIEVKIQAIVSLLDECAELCDSGKQSAFRFISEQMKLINVKQFRYSSELMVFACSFFFSFPSAYKFLRDHSILTLPHPTYLKVFNLRNIGCGINESLKKYLNLKCQALESNERLVNLQLDEIYVKPKISYTAKKVVGIAANASSIDVATTVQAFFIKSVLSNVKDIVAIVPVKNIDGDYLCSLTFEVLNLLHDVGFEVVSIIADNNKVNVKLYKLICKDTYIHSFIVSPFDDKKKIFLLFDTVHILKNLRNNWINEKSQTLVFPSFYEDQVKSCKFKHIVNIYEEEKLAVVKHAPGLSYKVCYPNSLERQNVKYVTPLFEDKTIAAVENYVLHDTDANGTKEWLEIIRNWWMIVNVKHPKKGMHLREKHAYPVRSVDQENVLFLKSFSSWLKKWNDTNTVGCAKSHGKLSRETFSAIVHTTDTLIDLIQYLLTTLQFHYVLLGSFQTDDLELRFGKYRRMSGCNYNISVQQIMESERKLKVTSILKLRSQRHINIKIHELVNDFNSVQMEDDREIELHEECEEVLADCDEVDVESSTLEIIIFLAGYVAYKVSSRSKCGKCNDLLMTPSELNCVLPQEVHYLNNINRGGLKYPSIMSTEIGICTYQVFETLISEKYEKRFVGSDSMHGFLKCLVIERLDLDNFSEQCECGKLLEHIVNASVGIWINILLKNYSKLKTNVCTENLARKGNKRENKLAMCAGTSRKRKIFMNN